MTVRLPQPSLGNRDACGDGDRSGAVLHAVLIRDLVREGDSAIGVELQSATGAPSAERLRIEYRSYAGQTFPRDLLLDALRVLLPVAESGGQKFGIRHDAENFRVIAFAVPRDADDADFHDISSVFSELGQPEGVSVHEGLQSVDRGLS